MFGLHDDLIWENTKLKESLKTIRQSTINIDDSLGVMSESERYSIIQTECMNIHKIIDTQLKE